MTSTNSENLKNFHLSFPIKLISSSDESWEVDALLDCGATGNFIDIKYSEYLGLKTITKKKPEKVHAVDGKELTSGMVILRTEE